MINEVDLMENGRRRAVVLKLGSVDRFQGVREL